MQLISRSDSDGFIFNFNPTVIREIQTAQGQYRHVTIPEDIQDQLRDTLLQSNQLSFCSYYCEAAVFKTTIYRDGQIIQQVSQGLLYYPELLTLIVGAHYWLISELFLVKRSKSNHTFIKLFLLSLLILLVIFIYLLLT